MIVHIKIRLFLFRLFLPFFLFTSAKVNAALDTEKIFVIHNTQIPGALKKFGAQTVYLYHVGGDFGREKSIVRNDTIIDFARFKAKTSGIEGYQLVFHSNNYIDSAYRMDEKLIIFRKSYRYGDRFLRCQWIDESGHSISDDIIDFQARYMKQGRAKAVSNNVILEEIIKYNSPITESDKINFGVSKVWVLSIGIDDYGKYKFRTCKSDAVSYSTFFKEQYRAKIPGEVPVSVTQFTLTDSLATKDFILGALKEIARRASANDYFVFNFSGITNSLPGVPEASGTYFFPWEIVVKDNQEEGATIANRIQTDDRTAISNCISLRVLQEHIQAIPAVNQLFISEAGPSGKFRAEFIRTMMQNSYEVARILDKNRVIIVPNGFGYDGVRCNNKSVSKGPINFYITSLESANVFDLFGNESSASQVAYLIRSKAWQCQSFDREYFDIFFERKFLKEYEELLSGDHGGSRGFKPDKKELKKIANLNGRSYALVVGTNNYKGSGWKNLPNAIHDARAVSSILKDGYGFEVQLLEDKPIDTIYRALTQYYQKLQGDDQFIIYFAGHGDMENEFMDDGFIVCTDSKSRDDDPTRNSYIQYVKLQKMVNKIPARQILVMLDVCHGGTFNQKRSDPVRTIANRNVQQFLQDQSQFVCRKFLSSVGSDEAFDGKPGDHSPFANLLLQVLAAKGSNSNGIVTLSNIYAVLQTAAMNETATLKISPQKDGFGKDNPESEFILIPVETTDTVKTK